MSQARTFLVHSVCIILFHAFFAYFHLNHLLSWFSGLLMHAKTLVQENDKRDNKTKSGFIISLESLGTGHLKKVVICHSLCHNGKSLDVHG